MKFGWFIRATLCSTMLVLAAWAEPGGERAAQSGVSDRSSEKDSSSAFRTTFPTANQGQLSGMSKLRVGDQIDPENVHTVTRPGLYGIGKVPVGSAYGVVRGNLVRYNPETMRLQSVIRSVEVVLD